jgi:CRISPR-associated endonuclease/helicase Cas3
MSATFPNVLQNELGFLSAKELIPRDEIEKQYRTRIRTKIHFMEDILENHLDEVSSAVRSGKRVLVVLNTVKRAQDVYRILKEEFQITDALLLHSRYTFEDRYDRESGLINQHTSLPSLLVSTQVVEVSLNISYDVMYTEACYIDSLVQRAGRVNRFNDSPEPCVVNVFLPKNHYPYQQALLRKAIDLISMKQGNISSEWDYVRIANMFYDDIWDSIRNDSDERFYSIWENTRYIFSADLSDEETQELLRTRTGSVSIPAFPLSFRDTIQQIQKQMEHTTSRHDKMRLQRAKRRYLVNVPLVYGIKFTDDSVGRFVNRAYTKEYGLLDDFDNMI